LPIPPDFPPIFHWDRQQPTLLFFIAEAHVMKARRGRWGRMDESAQAAAWDHSIDLAQEEDFDLGSLRVRPARSEVAANGTSQTLQRRVMQVLVALAEARGSVVSHNDLVIRCWRGLSVSDDAIVRCISMLRKLAAEHPEQSFAIETIPGVGYRLTSFGSDASSTRPSTSAGRRPRLSLVVSAVLAVAILVGAVVWSSHRGTTDRNTISVSVQPFDALSDSEGALQLARSVPNEVVNALGDSQIEAVLAGEGAGKSVAGLFEASGPGLIVTGQIRDDGRNTNVNVRIEDGATHAALWSTEFKRDSSRVSDLPLEVAARVADEINMVNFARTANPPLADTSALSALLQTTDMIRDPPQGAWAQMIDRAHGLVARHPEFAFAHDVLAAAYAEAAQEIDVPDRAKAMSEAAWREANTTLKLDPQDAGAYAILSDLLPAYNHRAREAILLRGIQIAKHPKEPLGGLYSAEGRLLDDVGRLRESESLKLVAHATDEWGAPKTAQLARAYANMGNLQAARDWLQKGIQLWPNHSGVRRVQRYVAAFYEPPSEALAAFDRLDAQDPSGREQDAVWRAYVDARSGHGNGLKKSTIQRIGKAADRGLIALENGIMMYAGLGASDEAIAAANSALDRQQHLQPWFLFTPITRNLRQDPAFVPLAARMGLISYWRDTGKRPDFCTDPARRSECTPQLLAALRS